MEGRWARDEHESWYDVFYIWDECCSQVLSLSKATSGFHVSVIAVKDL